VTQAALAVLDNLQSDKGRPTGRSFFRAPPTAPKNPGQLYCPENLPRRWQGGKEGIIIELANRME
jgi:hypothetical protein